MGSSVKTRNLKPKEETEESESIFAYSAHLAAISMVSMTIKAALDIGIFDIISKAGPGAKLSPAEIAAQLPTSNPQAPMMLDRILRLLASHHMIGCTTDGFLRRYNLTPVSKYFVPNEDGVSLAPLMALIHDKVFYDSWFELKDAVLEGGVPFIRAHGVHLFEYTYKDKRFSQVFNSAMSNITMLFLRRFLDSYKGFENLKQIVDIGGGTGVTLGFITSKYPGLKGVNFDLQHVIEHAPHYPGVEHVWGDMFESVPKGDAILLKAILHDWNDQDCLKLLKNCYNATPKDGKVIVVDAVLQVNPVTEGENYSEKNTSYKDITMMIQNPGGRERMEHEILALATGSGFRGVKFVCRVCDEWIMEFYK